MRAFVPMYFAVLAILFGGGYSEVANAATTADSNLGRTNRLADCLFDWAEQRYPSIIAPASISQTSNSFYYRYYSGTQAFLVSDAADGHIYGLSNGHVTDYGLASIWYATSGCAPLPDSSSLAQQCALPRAVGTLDPLTNKPYDDRQGSLFTELAWIRSFVNETYLWYQDVPNVDPYSYGIGATVPYVKPANNAQSSLTLNSSQSAVDAYFNSQRTSLLTPSGKPKDRYHYTYPTKDWLAEYQSGEVSGFGFQLAILAGAPPRKIYVVYVNPNTPAAMNEIQRGGRLLSVNGVDIVSGNDIASINEAISKPIPGKQYAFQILDWGSNEPRSVTLTAGSVTSTPVLKAGTLPAPNNKIGYLLFNQHIATAEKQLVTAINQLKAANNGAGISDLVLDLRYNGGGFLNIASQLAYMIAGATATSGKYFEKRIYNDKNPFSLTADAATTLFHMGTLGYSGPSGQPLPQLGLSRVYIISSSSTCSASESIINGLRGIGIDVILVGGTTCGKPYGTSPKENCSTTYFTIQFKGANFVGFGDYADGFVPGGTGTDDSNLPGCMVADDLSKPLGDPDEKRLAAVLSYRSTGLCPDSSVRSFAGPMVEPLLIRSLLHEMRY